MVVVSMMRVHTALSCAFVAAATLRLAYGCATGEPPSPSVRVALAALDAAVPFTAIGPTLSAPPRWRGVFVTSMFTAIFTAVALLQFCDEREADCSNRHLDPLVACAWAASALQFAHRCVFYDSEVADAARCTDREAFFSMCSFNACGRKWPCTILNQAFMCLIASKLQTACGADLLLALALSDYLCVFQLFLARQRKFPTGYFLEGATLASSVPATAVFAAHGRAGEAALLCGALGVWLAVGRRSSAA